MQDIGYSQEKPVAAFTVYKCLLFWKLFEAERTSVFDRLIQMIGSAIEEQLGAYVEKIFGIIRDNIKKELISSLSSCIQAPSTSRGTALRASGRSFGNDNSPTNHWRAIIDSLNSVLNTLQENFSSFTARVLYI